MVLGHQDSHTKMKVTTASHQTEKINYRIIDVNVKNIRIIITTKLLKYNRKWKSGTSGIAT